MMEKVILASNNMGKIKEFREMTDEWLDFIFCMWSD